MKSFAALRNVILLPPYPNQHPLRIKNDHKPNSQLPKQKTKGRHLAVPTLRIFLSCFRVFPESTQ
jgi:hypothetical protein